MGQKPQDAAKEIWESTTLSLLSEDQVVEIYDRLADMEVSLDADPLAFGPKRLQEKMAQWRKCLSETERIFLDVRQSMHKAKRNLRAKKAALDLSTKFLYAEDPEVRSGRNIADRDAFAAIKLKEEWMEVHTCEQLVQDIEAVIIVVKAKRSDLRDTQGRLRDQLRLCQQELDLGGRWGSKRLNAPELEPGQGVATGADVEVIDNLIDRVNDEIHLMSLDDEDDDVETPAEETTFAFEGNLTQEETFVNPDDNLDFSEFDSDESSEPEEKSEPEETSKEVELQPEQSKVVLVSNDMESSELDEMLNKVTVPHKVASSSGTTDQDVDALLKMFE